MQNLAASSLLCLATSIFRQPAPSCPILTGRLQSAPVLIQNKRKALWHTNSIKAKSAITHSKRWYVPICSGTKRNVKRKAKAATTGRQPKNGGTVLNNRPVSFALCITKVLHTALTGQYGKYFSYGLPENRFTDFQVASCLGRFQACATVCSQTIPHNRMQATATLLSAK